MKQFILTSSLFLATVVAIIGYPVVFANHPQTITRTTNPVVPVPVNAAQAPRIEAVFVLDTTGSMGGLLQSAKEKIWSIATTMGQADPAPEIKIGLIGYRDRGDAYITKSTPLSSDLDSVYATLMGYQAGGGGDTPESVNQALHEAVINMQWSQDKNTYRVIFLVGDAPPHMDYHNDVKYPQSIALAKSKGIVVNTIQCGQMPETKSKWQHMAKLSTGDYFSVDQKGSAVAIATPYDKKLAELAKKLDETRIFYGDQQALKEFKSKDSAKAEVNARSSITANARRAEFNASKSGRKNLAGEHDLVDKLASGKITENELDERKLPAVMAPMSAPERSEYIAKHKAQREQLTSQVKELSKKRQALIQQEVEKTGVGAASIDNKLFNSIKKQSKDIGIRYKSDAPTY